MAQGGLATACLHSQWILSVLLAWVPTSIIPSQDGVTVSTVCSGGLPGQLLFVDWIARGFAGNHDSIRVQLVYLDLHVVCPPKVEDPGDGFAQPSWGEWWFFSWHGLHLPISEATTIARAGVSVELKAQHACITGLLRKSLSSCLALGLDRTKLDIIGLIDRALIERGAREELQREIARRNADLFR